MDAQADLCLRWAHMSFCLFCHAAAHSFLSNKHSNLDFLSTQKLIFVTLDADYIYRSFMVGELNPSSSSEASAWPRG